MTTICTGGVPIILGGETGGVLLPLLGDWEAGWHKGVKIAIYLLGLLWCFYGVSIIADIFMTSIETITSKKRQVTRAGQLVTVKVWNDTVANLTLMALGSSAPEILLSLIELVLTEKWHAGALGPSTIVGSAAFNLLCITAVCVSSIPEGEVRRVENLPVFGVTASFSVFAYLWLLFILLGPTPDVVDIAEGVLTFLFFPLLVVVAFLVDKRCCCRLARRSPRSLQGKQLVFSTSSSHEDCEAMMKELEKKYGCMPHDPDDRDALLYYEFAPAVSRAAHRVNATRMMSGGKAVMITRDRWLRGQRVALLLRTKSKDAVPDAFVEFAASHYAVLESERKVLLDVRVERNGHHRERVTVNYQTKDGSAEAGKDYKKTRGTLKFEASEEVKTIEVEIVGDEELEPTEEFYVVLEAPKGCTLGAQLKATVVVLDANGPGKLRFMKPAITVPATALKATYPVKVLRDHGATGKVSCSYRTQDDTAKANYDYTAMSGTLTFAPGVTQETIDIQILPKSSHEKQERFRVVLADPEGGVVFDQQTDGGKECNILTVYIADDPDSKKTYWNRFLCEFNWDNMELGHSSWRQKFAEAIFVNGSREAQHSATMLDCGCHAICLPWKLIFAFVPPTNFIGGWLCFFSSLVMIGVLTAIIGDMANLLGCALDMKAEICAVTFVALGTSLPDTFASRTAAMQDPTADNSIGNVTGSNSVNVFLGLGLPWMLGAFYWKSQGATRAWHERGRAMGWPAHIFADHPNGAFVVVGGNLGVSVGVFVGCAVTCIALLLLRRGFCGGELGGDKRLAYATSLFLVLLWGVYIAMSIVSEGGVSPYA
mmetsp:Transcript_34900/g.99622  ORF Transcript_34900/g.99622 Transcript_34900/m.99622 type:complete len:825 (-) Transcript_34900:277-2751(-)